MPIFILDVRVADMVDLSEIEWCQMRSQADARTTVVVFTPKVRQYLNDAMRESGQLPDCSCCEFSVCSKEGELIYCHIYFPMPIEQVAGILVNSGQFEMHEQCAFMAITGEEPCVA